MLPHVFKSKKLKHNLKIKGVKVGNCLLCGHTATLMLGLSYKDGNILLINVLKYIRQTTQKKLICFQIRK